MFDTFHNNNNIDLLWEVLLEEPYVQTLSNENKRKLYDSFMIYKKIFMEKEKEQKDSLSLVEMNKKFLTFFIQTINSQKNEMEKEYIYKKEDIQAERQSVFEKNLAKTKMEFESMNTFTKPPPIDFSEKIEDTKIKEMDTLIANTIAQRNYEINQIHQNSYSLETKNKKPNTNTNTNTNERMLDNNLKQIKIEDFIPIKHNVINLKNDEKKISWKNNDEIKYYDKNENENENENEILIDPLPTNAITNSSFLNKLKKIKSSEEELETESIEEKNEKELDPFILNKLINLMNNVQTEIMVLKRTMNNIENKISNFNHVSSFLLNK